MAFQDRKNAGRRGMFRHFLVERIQKSWRGHDFVHMAILIGQATASMPKGHHRPCSTAYGNQQHPCPEKNEVPCPNAYKVPEHPCPNDRCPTAYRKQRSTHAKGTIVYVHSRTRAGYQSMHPCPKDDTVNVRLRTVY